MDPRRIACRYLRSWFFLDLLACIDPSWFSGGGDAQGGPNKAVRLSRMYRIGRLAKMFRLIRLSRLLKMNKVLQNSWFKTSPTLMAIRKILGQSRFAAVMKFLAALMLLVHLLACGWYLTTAFSHTGDGSKTWLGDDRRQPQILDDDPSIHWLTS